MSWRTLTLGELVRFRNGKSVKPGGEGPYPVFGSNGIIGGSDEFLYRDAIILGRVGAYCGSVAYCPARFWASDNTIVVEPDKASFDTRFAFYAITHANLARWAGGAAQPLITQTGIKGVPIPIPPLDVQRRIAGILSAYDDLIEVNTRRITILEEMALRLFDEWFVHFRFPAHHPQKTVEGSNGRMPGDWHTGAVKDVVVLQRGFDLPSKERSPGSYPVIAATGAHGTHVVAKVRAPGVVTGRSGSLGTVLHVDEDFWPLNTTLWGKEFPLRSTYYAYFVLKNLDLKGQDGGAAVPTLNRNVVHKLVVPIPPIELVGRFDALAAPMFEFQSTLIKANAALRAARDLLLPKLISGEIDLERAQREAEVEAKRVAAE